MKDIFQKLPFRSGVGVAVLNDKNQLFVGKRIDNPKDFWQMPQGGMDKGENFYEAALRELKEETNIETVTLIKEIEGFFTYNLPDDLLGIIWKGKFRGQKQKWFIFKFVGDEKEININTKKPEFIEWKWINIENLTEKVVDFKLHIYEQIKIEVKKYINLS